MFGDSKPTSKKGKTTSKFKSKEKKGTGKGYFYF